MAEDASPRVEVELRVSRKLYLSKQPRFDLVLLLTLRNSPEPLVFLKTGSCEANGLQPINSDQIIQCIDVDSGEKVRILPSSTTLSFLRLEPDQRGYVTFTTSSAIKEYELPLSTYSLQAGKNYKIHYTPINNISHWPSSTFPSPDSPTSDLPPSSTPLIPWPIISKPTLVFSTHQFRPPTPQVTASLTAPKSLSLSRSPPYKFTLTFSTTAPHPITIQTNRSDVRATSLDLEMRAAGGGEVLGPDRINESNDGPWQRGDFLCIDGRYTEEREIDLTSPFWSEAVGRLGVGGEVVVRHLGERWRWWSEDGVDEVMEYANGEESTGLGDSWEIEVGSAGEVRVRVVE
ncbi:hypothetical protein EJ04DRAFT_604261 [Polyplosphaeria fusca]|uniref:Uncharacterized protein n=1 Tax=Polyplosphaeria fusca TaxID=682080 RepID=A0A9P4QWS2_9PLEO|nr:hypothetical protein EJ04DRAFT_604261 [Polyplosphaeria fusca]